MKSTIVVMHEGMQDRRIEALLSNVMDVVIDMRSKEEQVGLKRYIRIKAARNMRHNLEPYEYRITESGIIILEGMSEKTIGKY